MINILIIDNISDRLKYISERIHSVFRESFIYTANNTFDAEKIINNHNPDVILLGGLSNNSERFRYSYNLKQEGIPVLFIINEEDTQENMQMALDAGAYAFLALKAEETEIMAQIEVMLKIKLFAESENRYRNIVDYSTCIVLEWDTDGNIIFLNKYGLEFFGFEAEEIIGKNVLGTIVEPVDTSGYNLEEKMQVVQKEPEKFYSSENENVRKNGEKVWIAWTNKGKYDNAGKLVKTLSIGIDRTQQRLLEKSLLSYKDDLEKKVDARTLELTSANQKLAREVKERRVAEAKTEESQALIKSIINSTSDMIWSVDAECFGLLEWNTAFNNYFLIDRGIKVDIGMTPADLFPKGSKFIPYWTGLYKRVLLEGSFLTEYTSYSGTRVLLINFGILTRKGKTYGISIFAKNITAQKQAEKKLLKSNRFYSFISQINQMIVHAKDKNKLLEEACKIAVDYGALTLAWIGLVDKEGKYIIPAVSAGHEDGYLKQVGKIPINDTPEGNGPAGKAVRFDRYYVCSDFKKDPAMKPWGDMALKRGYQSSIALPIKMYGEVIGAYILYAGSPDFFDEEEISLLSEIAHDISFALEVIDTEKKNKKAEEQIRTLSAVVEQSPSMIVITDKKGKVAYINEGFKSFTQYSNNEIIGHLPFEFQQKYHTKESYNLMWSTLKKGDIWRSEFNSRKRDGTKFREEVTVFPLTGSEGFVSNYIIIKNDVTEKRQLVDDLIDSKIKAEESDRLKSAFLANMSHELRTPMSAILGFAALLKDPQICKEECVTFLQIIEDNANRLLNLMNAIINISKIESGEMKIMTSSTNIINLLEHKYNNFQNEAKQKGLHLILKNLLPLKESIIKTDVQKLDAIIDNLIQNAIKFTKEGTIEFGCMKYGDKIKFFVKDTGEGISVENQEIIFEKFRQGNLSYNRNHEGAGLGLPITKSYVEILGGSIWVKSKIGKGSTFYFTIQNIEN